MTNPLAGIPGSERDGSVPRDIHINVPTKHPI